MKINPNLLIPKSVRFVGIKNQLLNLTYQLGKSIKEERKSK